MKFPREDLVIDGQCTPKFLKVLTEIFELYSTQNRLSIESFIEFIKTCVDEDIIRYNDKRIKMFLDKYDLDKDLLVSLESLVKFYIFSEKDKNEIIWNNLYNFNIKNDLKNVKKIFLNNFSWIQNMKFTNLTINYFLDTLFRIKKNILEFCLNLI